MASPPSLPAFGAEERFDKAKKHLWASESPTHEENQTDRPTERRELGVKSPSPEYIRMRLSHSATPERPRSPQLTGKPQAPEHTLRAPSNRPQHVLPPFSRDGFNFDHNRRLPPPRSWNATEHGNPRDRPISSRIASTSLAEPRANNDSLQRPVSLSVFNSPTATYMWPGLQAASQMSHPPIIYVNYDNRDSMRSASTSSALSVHDSPVISPSSIRNSSSRNAMESTGYVSRARHVDPLSRPQYMQSSQRQNKHPPLQPIRPSTIASGRAASVNNYSITSEEDDQLRTSREPSPQISEASEGETISRPTRYAKPTLSPDGTTRKWQCTWPTPEDRKKPTCEYTSKKQLVKRHVETTHLRYKPFICEVCKKGFPQKTSLDTHMHGHTGSTPHVCRYGCGMAFKDPARRHRHMVEEHGYIPRQSKKKHKARPSPQEGTAADPVRPFTFISGSDG
ncbi:hypothetical protein EV363DRAFT_1393754 [Boletus edulis]|nr:hypothetical protein EV363DRAFT_1393754 [Boletus edulis]